MLIAARSSQDFVCCLRRTAARTSVRLRLDSINAGERGFGAVR